MVIVGGGLAGSLVALALINSRPEVPLILVEQGERFGGNHIWSFFDTDLSDAERQLIEPLITRHWPSHDIRFPARRRTLGIGYNSVRSEQLDRVVRDRLGPDRYRLGRGVAMLAADHVILEGGDRIDAFAVLDARGPGPVEGLELGWQKFVGRTYRFDRPHDCPRPIIMDATVDQSDGYRFLYSLPFSVTELMVEDTFYSTDPSLDPGPIGEGLDQRMQARCIAEETGVLPVLLGGSVDALWPERDPPIAKLGLRGGFFHPTTGYSLPDACSNALLIAGQADLSGSALRGLLFDRARTLWSERSFYQLLNRMLFHAAEPRHRYRVLEHFYRLPEPVIARFYAARLTALDKVRILSGRPPVPVGRAIAAMRGKAA